MWISICYKNTQFPCRFTEFFVSLPMQVFSSWIISLHDELSLWRLVKSLWLANDEKTFLLALTLVYVDLLSFKDISQCVNTYCFLCFRTPTNNSHFNANSISLITSRKDFNNIFNNWARCATCVITPRKVGQWKNCLKLLYQSTGSDATPKPQQNLEWDQTSLQRSCCLKDM